MTEIKIPFTKTKIETIPVDKLDAVEISTSFKMGEGLGVDLSKCHGGTPENTFARMFFVFKDGVENNLYDDLLSSSKTNFELSFDKEKVFLMVGGFANFIDKTKPEIQVYPAPNSRKIGVFFEPKFSGIIKLTATSQGPTGPEIPLNISQVRNNAIAAIKQALNSEPKLTTTSDLSSECQNWETTINSSNDETRINSLKDKVLIDINNKRAERERERERESKNALNVAKTLRF